MIVKRAQFTKNKAQASQHMDLLGIFERLLEQKMGHKSAFYSIFRSFSSIIKKTGKFGSLLLLTHLFVMCPRCADEQIEFEFVAMTVEALDNSGAYPTRTTSDTLYRQAVAFVVEVYDTTRHYGDWWATGWSPIRKAQAISIDCEPIFTLGSVVTGMEIITLFDLSSAVGSGAEASGNFLASFGYYQPENLYLSLEELFEQKRGRYSFPFPKDEWYLFYRGRIDTDSVGFLFRVFLEDGRTLEANSPVIYLKD